jgi:hypothetical protein
VKQVVPEEEEADDGGAKQDWGVERAEWTGESAWLSPNT